MARPHKMIVDYFPHYCNHGKTLYILQNKFQNDGYAFWFKLLELLAATEGHAYDFNKSQSWQFLLAKTQVSEDIANDILNTLIDLEAIDRELAEKKIIWCQNFINNIADVYKRRQVPLPEKPGKIQPSPNAIPPKPTSYPMPSDGPNGGVYVPVGDDLPIEEEYGREGDVLPEHSNKLNELIEATKRRAGEKKTENIKF